MTDAASAYRVLARKYRPQAFQDLIGQETLVTVLTQALQTERIPHAIILTGVRGVGKTTSARLIARALNCAAKAVEPCNTCASCTAIKEDRSLDVIEMDAASRTGVDDIRSVIETAHYRPVASKYKVFIIDEVHMLSKSAFNALLKTLEEPPSHVVFIFATTEVRKVPDTVLSRCIRFDLRRLTLEDIQTLLKHVLKAEGVSAEEKALQLLARKADGSARDALSLLDQALNLSSPLTEKAAREMLHLTDGLTVIELFQALVKGTIPSLLEAPRRSYDRGGDPLSLLQDLADLCYQLSLLKTHPPLVSEVYTDQERAAMQTLADTLSIPVLARLWQGLMKGIQETESYGQPLRSVEMVLLRLAYLSLMPTPYEIIEALGSDKQVPKMSSDPLPENQKDTLSQRPMPKTFIDLVKLLGDQRELLMQATLRHDVHLVAYEPGKLLLKATPRMPKDFISRLRQKLEDWTQHSWTLQLTDDEGSPTLKQQETSRQRQLEQETQQDPLVKEALAIFPEAYIESIETGEET